MQGSAHASGKTLNDVDGAPGDGRDVTDGLEPR
jgi:hypothetical protein